MAKELTIDDIQVAVFTGGELKLSGNASKEAVLAMPLNRMIVKMIRVPAGADAVETAMPILQAMSPYPDETMTIGWELVREDADGRRIILAAALPESSTDDIAELLDAVKVNVTRVDLQVLGELRNLWGRINTEDGRRRLIRIKSADCLTLLVMDGGVPCSIRAITDESDLKRETMLSLLEAEDFGGPKELVETIDAEASEEVSRGIAERALDASGLNALPESWREVLEEERFKGKLIKWLSIVGGVWVLIMMTLLGVPMVYGFMTDYQKGLSKEHSRQYRAVEEMKSKTELVQKYSDRARSALEMIKAVSDRLPEGVTLSSWDYRRGYGISVSGDADEAKLVYDFKNNMTELADGDEEKVFQIVNLDGPSGGRDGKQRFKIDMRYHEEEE